VKILRSIYDIRILNKEKDLRQLNQNCITT